MNRALLERLRFVDFVLDHFGQVNRRHVMDFYGVSQAQASLDLSSYRGLAPANLEYDATAKAYCRSASFRRAFP